MSPGLAKKARISYKNNTETPNETSKFQFTGGKSASALSFEEHLAHHDMSQRVLSSNLTKLFFFD